MKIGIDLDGVIVENYPVWKAFFIENEKSHKHVIRGTDMPKKIQPTWDYLQKICRKCWNKCLHEDRFILGYHARPEACATISYLKSSGNETHLITSRPPDVTEATFRWLKAHNMDTLFDTVTITDEKVKIAEALGCQIMLDDAPHNILAFEHSDSVDCVIWDAPYNAHLPGTRVNTWYQFYNIVEIARANARSSP